MELEEELKVVGNSLKSLEVSEEKVRTPAKIFSNFYGRTWQNGSVTPIGVEALFIPRQKFGNNGPFCPNLPDPMKIPVEQYHLIG